MRIKHKTTHAHTHTHTHTEAIAPRGSGRSGAAMVPVLEGDTSQLEAAVNKGEGRSTLRLKKDGQAVVEEVVSQTFTGYLRLSLVLKYVFQMAKLAREHVPTHVQYIDKHVIPRPLSIWG